MQRERIIESYKIMSPNFLIRAFERPKDATLTLTERRNKIEFMIDYIYKFKILLAS